MSTSIYIAAAVVLLIVVWFAFTYNALVTARNRVEESWSGVDVQLKRRSDLVPNLVSAVAGYAQHERQTLEAVTQARSEATRAGAGSAREKAETRLSGALAQLGVVAEQYPQLRASDNFKQLQHQLSEIETEIAAARRIYNSNVRFINDRVQAFPSSIVAAITSFQARDFFEVELLSERGVPEASFA